MALAPKCHLNRGSQAGYRWNPPGSFGTPGPGFLARCLLALIWVISGAFQSSPRGSNTQRPLGADLDKGNQFSNHCVQCTTDRAVGTVIQMRCLCVCGNSRCYWQNPFSNAWLHNGPRSPRLISSLLQETEPAVTPGLLCTTAAGIVSLRRCPPSRGDVSTQTPPIQ